MLQDPATAGSLQDKMCIEPWHAMQLEKEQSRAATLVTSIELLHSLSEQHANGDGALLSRSCNRIGQNSCMCQLI